MTDTNQDKTGKEFVDWITIPTWWKPGGGMMYNRNALGANNPEHTYNYVKKMLEDAKARGDMGDATLRPEDFGVKNPKAEMFKGVTRDELIDEIISLRENIESYEFNQVPFRCYQ